MRIAAIFLALAMFAITLRAQPPAPKPGSVQGVVTSSITGEPVRKAMVALEDTKSHNNKIATSDAMGRFQFDSVTPGLYYVSAVREGFQASNEKRTRVVVTEEQNVKDVVVKVVPLASVSGHVLDEDGDPIVRAQIRVLQYYYGSGRKWINTIGVAQANDLGEFDVVNLPPGRYYFQVMAPSPRSVPPHTRWTHPEEAYPVTYYPNVRELGQATAIEIAAGAHLSNIDFRLGKVPAFHVRGTVTGVAAGAGPEGRVEVTTLSGAPDNLAGAAPQADGSFDLRGLVSGSYSLSYLRFGIGGRGGNGQTIFVSDSDVNGVNLAENLPISLSGTVAVEGTQPNQLNIQISLSSEQGRGPRGASTADGRFEVKGVPPQVCQVQVSNLPPGTYVKSIRFGDHEINSGELDLTESPAAPLNILLAEDGGEVDGNVQTASGQPAVNTQVTLAPTEEYDGRSDLFKRVVTDASGNFQIKDVAPGEYKVFAWETDSDGSTRSAEFRKPFESKSSSVTVGPKGKDSVQLTVITADDIAKERSKLP
jgi:large repetitive protein